MTEERILDIIENNTGYDRVRLLDMTENGT